MNLLFTCVGDFMTLESQACIATWRARSQIVKLMPIDRVPAYLRLDPSSALALVDAIVCAADTDMIETELGPIYYHLDFPLKDALEFESRVRDLPEICTMRDGRKWKSIPIVIFCSSSRQALALSPKIHKHTHICRRDDAVIELMKIQSAVDSYRKFVLNGYERVGMLIRVKEGRAQIGPALRRKEAGLDDQYYYAPSDRRKLARWVTVARDKEGLRRDVEEFEELLDRRVDETKMQKFFEEQPLILMEARGAIPIPHVPNFSQPRDNRPDFAFVPILGPVYDKSVELLELKGPADGNLNLGPHRGFSAKVKKAVDQVRDYGRFLKDQRNYDSILRAFGFVPTESNLGVLIGRAPTSHSDMEVWARRQEELNVRVVTYDEILQTQADQLAGPHDSHLGFV